MSAFTLPSRQRLSRRIPTFGDALSYRTSLQNRSDLTQWQKMIMLDPEGQSVANYMANNAAAPDLFPLPIPAEYLQYLSDMGTSVSQPPFQKDPPVTQPATPTTSDNVGTPNPTGMTTADYEAMVKKNNDEAAALAAKDADMIARQNAIRNAPAQDPAFQENPPVTTSTNVPEVKAETKKTNSLILPAIAGLAAYLLLKG